jgi:hypothetical protein
VPNMENGLDIRQFAKAIAALHIIVLDSTLE